jgi:tetratricopeptide (TPR) repeat protein
MFVWGSGDFGTGWQKTLTDDDGPYVELMASAYSDNQPDFSWLQPYETKTFSQVWYPFKEIGSVKNANRAAAVNLEGNFLGVYVTGSFPKARVVLKDAEEIILDQTIDLSPRAPFTRQLNGISEKSFVVVYDAAGNEIISYKFYSRTNPPLPDTAKPPKLPQKITSLDELYLTGQHVEQYLHFSLDPAPYWERALELDPADSRSNNALGRLLLRRGDFTRAESFFRRCIQTLTRYNFNPYDGEPFYNLGLALTYQGRFDEAYDNFYKATWSYAQRSAGYFSLAQIDTRRGDYAKALEHLDRSLVTDAHNLKAHALKAVVLRKLGDSASARLVLDAALALDPLNHWAHSELALLTGDKTELLRLLRGDVQNYLDLAFDYADAGLFDEARDLLESITSSYPMVCYALGYFYVQMGDSVAAMDWIKKAAQQPADWCFPIRLEEQLILESARMAASGDGHAAYYLGNLYYDKKQYAKAIDAWQAASELEPDFAISWRNLGIALYNKRGDKTGAKRCYEQALKANPNDPRLPMEMDQLLQRLGVSPTERLAELTRREKLVEQRDDLSMTYAELYSQTGQPEKALAILASRHFHAWEGGEGGAAGQYALAQVVLGLAASEQGDPNTALAHFEAAQNPPGNLGVGRGMSLYDALAWYKTAETLSALGKPEKAQEYFRKIVDTDAGIALWGGQTPLAFYAALSLRALGQEAEAAAKLQALLEFAGRRLADDVEDSFYTSKPAMIVFDDDPRVASQIQGYYLSGLAHLGLGHAGKAKTSFKSVLKLDPHHWWAKLYMKSKETLRKDVP